MLYKPSNFKTGEFFDIENMNPLILFIVDKLRDRFGKIFKCSFNTISTNEKNHKHSTNSKHYKNLAVDFWIGFKGIKMANKQTVTLVETLLKELCFWDNVGFGVYVNSKGYLSFHLDYRETHGDWMALDKNESGGWEYQDYDSKKIK